MKDLLVSRKFWAAVIGLVLIVITAWLPGFPAVENLLTDAAILVAAYILGTAAEGGRASAGSVIAGLLRSRKFWAALAGVVTLVLRTVVPGFPLDDGQLTAVILTIAAYIFGTGTQDGLANLAAAINGTQREALAG
jgi:type III secretory pathway component EscV